MRHVLIGSFFLVMGCVPGTGSDPEESPEASPEPSPTPVPGDTSWDGQIAIGGSNIQFQVVDVSVTDPLGLPVEGAPSVNPGAIAACVEGVFVGGSGAGPAVFFNGTEWVDADLPADTNTSAAACGNGVYVVTSDNGTFVGDGVNFTVGGTDLGYLNSLLFDGPTQQFWSVEGTSTNGSDWTAFDFGISPIYGVAKGDGKVIGLGDGNITVIDGGVAGPPVAVSTGTVFKGAAHDGTNWVLVGGNKVFTSTDGAAWTEVTGHGFGFPWTLGYSTSAAAFVAASGGSDVRVSKDGGQTWVLATGIDGSGNISAFAVLE